MDIFVPVIVLKNSGERLFLGTWGILPLFSFNLPALIITSNPKDPASCVKSTKSFSPSKSYCPSTFSWTCHAMYLWRRRQRSNDLLTICYLSLVHSIARGSIWELELTFLLYVTVGVVSGKLYYRIVLRKKNERPWMLFHGFVWYSLQDKTKMKVGQPSSTLHTEETLSSNFCFKEKKKKSKDKDSQESSNSVSNLTTTVKEQSVQRAVVTRACFSRARLPKMQPFSFFPF